MEEVMTPSEVAALLKIHLKTVYKLAEKGVIRTRLISARETARLMGLPEEYRLPARFSPVSALFAPG